MLTFLSFDNFFLIKNVKLQIYLRISWRCSHGFTKNTLMNALIMTFLRDEPLVEASKESWQRKRHCPQIMNAYCRSQVGHLGAHQKRIWTQRLLSLSITSYLCVNLLRINYHGLSIEWLTFKVIFSFLFLSMQTIDVASLMQLALI